MNSLLEIRLEAPLRLDSTLCSRFRSTKSECAACAVVCPVPGAVRLGNGAGNNGAEISAACVGCGACVSACPNGAIQLLEDDEKLAHRIGQRVQAGAVFRIACTPASGRADLVVPCLSRLTEALILEPMRTGARGVELCAPDCTGCGLAKAAPQWKRAMEFSRALCETAGLGAALVSTVPVAKGKAEEIRRPANGPNSRRGMLGSLSERWKRSSEVPAPTASGESTETTEPDPFREIVQRHSENSKRTALLRVLDALPSSSVVPKEFPRIGFPLAQLDIDRRCVGCNVCETLCPTGALKHREGDGVYTLEFDAAQCTGCQVCELVCYHQALHIRETVDLSLLFRRPKVVLVSARPTTCHACGERILAGATDYCPACQVSGDRREAVAQRFFSGGS